MEVSGEAVFQFLTVLFRHAAQQQGIAALFAEGSQRFDCRTERTGPDWKDKCTPALIAELGDHPVLKSADQLFIALVPNIDVSEIVVGAGTVLCHHDGVYPGLVTESDGFKLKGRHRSRDG